MSHADWLNDWLTTRERYNNTSTVSDTRDFDTMQELESKLAGTVASTGPDLLAQIDFLAKELECGSAMDGDFKCLDNIRASVSGLVPSGEGSPCS